MDKSINDILADMLDTSETEYELNTMRCYLSTHCIVCGESVKLLEAEKMSLYAGRIIPGKVCDKCKTAIHYVRDNFIGR